jgi:hypothetical protein
MRAIILLSDESETKKETVRVEQTDIVRKFLDLLPLRGSRDWYRFSTEVREVRCFCVRNNSLDRAKMLIRYLRKQLLFKKEQITLLRFSKFPTAAAITEALKEIFNNSSEDFLLYYSGHGISGNPTGWSNGGDKHVFYYRLRRVFESFQGRLIFINDCCHALAVEPYLRDLSGRYLLFGASRRRRVGSISVLDSVLGFWFHRRVALPRVQSTGRWREYIMDIPAFCVRGSYYNCNCGSQVTEVKTYKPREMPSLRRGTKLDHLLFPNIAGR